MGLKRLSKDESEDIHFQLRKIEAACLALNDHKDHLIEITSTFVDGEEWDLTQLWPLFARMYAAVKVIETAIDNYNIGAPPKIIVEFKKMVIQAQSMADQRVERYK